MTKPLQKILYLAILAIAIAGCNAGLSPQNAAFNKIISLDGMNTKLEFIALDSEDDPYKIGTSVKLGLKNLSENRIIFPSDYGLQLYTFQNGEWIRVDNKAQYFPEGNTQISPEGPDLPGQTTIGFFPDLIDMGKSTSLRVVIQGIVYEGDNPTDEEASAYIDIILLSAVEGTQG